jgi:hypothetical protein
MGAKTVPYSTGADKALEKKAKVNAQNRYIQYPICGNWRTFSKMEHLKLIPVSKTTLFGR